MLNQVAGQLERYMDLLSTRQKLVASNIAMCTRTRVVAPPLRTVVAPPLIKAAYRSVLEAGPKEQPEEVAA